MCQYDLIVEFLELATRQNNVLSDVSYKLSLSIDNCSDYMPFDPYSPMVCEGISIDVVCQCFTHFAIHKFVDQYTVSHKLHQTKVKWFYVQKYLPVLGTFWPAAAGNFGNVIYRDFRMVVVIVFLKGFFFLVNILK